MLICRAINNASPTPPQSLRPDLGVCDRDPTTCPTRYSRNTRSKPYRASDQELTALCLLYLPASHAACPLPGSAAPSSYHSRQTCPSICSARSHGTSTTPTTSSASDATKRTQGSEKRLQNSACRSKMPSDVWRCCEARSLPIYRRRKSRQTMCMGVSEETMEL